MDMFIKWLSENYGWVVSLLIQGFIAYHVFFLSQKLSSKARLEHKESIKRKADELLSEVRRKKLNSEVYLVNINRYFKDYPSNTEKRFEGYSHIRAEIKSTRFDGIEFFAEPPVEVYKKSNGSLSFKGTKKEKVFNAYPVGVVPYEWIEHVDISGDEYAYVPLFYCYYKGKTNWKFWKRFLFFGYPYKKMLYYKLSDVYDERNDPSEMKYSYIDQPIGKF
ncbi:MAG TPA: hypothetical protein VMY36_03085 [Patescibacteria group bacterium]|nr:hypothetical protein [Patescibacteria group bacterium]